jgi:hypothetical protein
VSNTGEPLLVKTIPPKVPFDLPDDASQNDTNEKVREILDHLNRNARYQNRIATLLNSDFAVDGGQINSLTVGQLTGGTINTTDINLGNNKFVLSSSLRRLTIKDDNNTTRVDLGRFGSGVSYGIKAYDDSGDLILDIDGLGAEVIGPLQYQAGSINSSTFFSNGVVTSSILASNSVTTAKIAANAVTAAEINVANLAAISGNFGTITSGTVSASVSVSAGAIDVGTLIADGSPVSIEITGSGALLFRSGGDIEMRSNGTDWNYITFYNDAGTTERLQISSQASYQRFNPTNDLEIASKGTSRTLYLGRALGNSKDWLNISVNSTNIIVNGTVRPGSNKGEDLGTSGIAFDDVWADDFQNVADIGLSNGWVICETDKVFEDAPPEDGLVVIREDGMIPFILGRDGYIYCKGFKQLEEYEHFDKKRKLSNVERKKITKYKKDFPEFWARTKRNRDKVINKDGTPRLLH